MNVAYVQPVSVDGCATGLTDANGTPLFKPWTIAVSSASLVEQLKDFRCDNIHERGKTAGSETAKTAYYPRALCEAICRGLDAHEHHRQGGDIPAAADAAAEAGNQTPLALGSSTVTGFEPGGLEVRNQPSVDFLDMPKTTHKEATVPRAPLFGPRLTRAPLDSWTRMTQQVRPRIPRQWRLDRYVHLIPVAVPPSSTTFAGMVRRRWSRLWRHPLPGLTRMSHRWTWRQATASGSANCHAAHYSHYVVIRRIANGSPESKSAGCRAALQKERQNGSEEHLQRGSRC